MILDTIVARKKEEVASLKERGLPTNGYARCPAARLSSGP